MKLNRTMNIWWLMFVLQISAMTLAYAHDLHLIFWHNDITYISSIILGFWAVCSILIGIQVFRRQRSTDITWFIADSCLTWGMIGTVTGFIYMLSSTFENIDPGNIATMRDAISTMATGMSTALLTTLAGLLASLGLKAQLITQDS